MALSLATINALTADAGGATGYIDFNSLPQVNDTMVINGQTFTFKTSSGGATEITIGGSTTASATNAAAILNASAHADVDDATYSSSGNRLIVTHDTAGSAGEAFTLAVGGAAAVAASSGTLTLLTGNVEADDTFTINGVAFTFKVSASTATEVTIGGSITLSLAALATRHAAHKVANPSAASSLVTLTPSGATLVIAADTGGTAGNSITYAWDFNTGTFGGQTSGSGTLSGGAAATRQTRSAATLALSSAATAFSDLPANRVSSTYEQSVASLILLIATVLRNTDSPVTDAAKARQQRTGLKRVLAWAASEVGSATGGTDTRDIVADRLVARLMMRLDRAVKEDQL